MTPAPILVLIVNYRTAALTVQAVEAILPELRDRGDASIVIVDNGSNDGSAEAIATAIEDLDAQHICFLLALDANLGFAGGNNAGLGHYRRIVHAAGRQAWPIYVWLLNPDTIAEYGALGALTEFLEGKPEAGLAGGRCRRQDGSIRHSAFRFHTPIGEFLTALDVGLLRRLLARHHILLSIGDEPLRAEWLSGSHLLIRGSVIERIGLLDPRYFLYFEETDYCARATEAGFEAWHVPASQIVHLGGRSTGLTEFDPALRQPHYWFESRARFFLRRHGVAATHLANLLWLLGTPVGASWALLRGRPRRDPARLWWDFLVSNYGRNGLMYRTAGIAA
ncbi:glycosyltransferase family 2 protein [Sphingomonas sp. SRS2]|uniref:glycosyltransferase family 2 protein n=1 Tax=Sphingomonas sp. SRS2 TaxID=133190 RepID=UPI0006184983|nr:glycosyltransferase family 2 protein [Sphingomonas sp. SRS2]KKC27816.1 glycosyl transferase [Sphingomonas sp. SRS2]